MRITTLIAEGEPRTRHVLQGLCTKRSDLELVAQVECGAAAVSAIESIRPELLVLDSHLPDMTAAEVLQVARTPEQAFTVLVTDREHHVSNPIQSDSLAYLAKPIRRRQFDDLIDVAVARRAATPMRQAQASSFALSRRGAERLLIGERAHRFHFLETRSVDYLEVDGNYVTIHVGNDRFLTRATLKQLSEVLAPHDFVRIDRSCLVNLRRVDYVERLERGQFAFTLRHGQRLVSSRERATRMLQLLRGPLR
jgi:two-component system, LytTR family, response regulator